jgi:hypothetical protein
MSLLQAFIVDPTYIKTNYPQYVDNNVDDNLLNSSILLAQDINTQSILGYNMWNYIITTLNNDATGASFSNSYKYIITNYIQKSLSLWALFQAFPSLWVKSTNKSIVLKKGDDSESVNITTFNMLRNEIKNNAMYYDARIQEYIQNNISSFPEYFTTIGVQRITPKNSTYATGIYLSQQGGNFNRIDIQNAPLNGKGVDLKW